MTTLAALFGALPLMLSTRLGRRAAPAARPGDGRRPARQPGADAVHDAGRSTCSSTASAARWSTASRAARRRGRDGQPHEPLVAVHRAAGRDDAAQPVGGAGRRGGVHAAAGVAAAAGRLPGDLRSSANLPGASPETMASTVATPLERALGTIAGVNEIDLAQLAGLDAHHRAVRPRQGHQRRRARGAGGHQRQSRSLLPSALPGMPQYRKINPSQAPIMILALTSKTRDDQRDVRPRLDGAGAEGRAGHRRRRRHGRRRLAAGGPRRAAARRR